MTDDRRHLDYRDPEWVSDRLGIEKNTVYKHLQDGTIPAVRLGKKWLISETRLVAWLAEQTDQQTRARREAAASAKRTAGRMDTLSPRARQVISAAHAEARRYGHRQLSQAHLLLAITSADESAGGRCLGRLGVTEPKLRKHLEAVAPPADGPVPRRLARTPDAKTAMRLAAALAAREDKDRTGTGELLLGIASAGQGQGVVLLERLGLTAEQIRQALSDGPATH